MSNPETPTKESNLSAAVQTLETLVEKWRDEAEHVNANRYTGWDRMTLIGCADELEEALAHLPRQKAGTE